MDKFILITGAANGLGKAIGEEFLIKGWTVFLTDILFDPHEMVNERSHSYRLYLDVTNEISIHEAFGKISMFTGKLDLLINNAGIFDLYPVVEASDAKLMESFRVNTFGMLRMIRVFLPMLVTAQGRVINISSESIKFPGLFQPYQASKIAMEGLHRTIRQELFLKGIQMALVRPGAIKTRLSDKVLNVPPIPSESIFQKEYLFFSRFASRFTGRFLEPPVVAKKIYRLSTSRILRGIYRIHHNPVLTMISLVPARWMMIIIKRKTGSLSD